MERLKCGAGEGWRISVWTDHVRNAEVLNRVECGINIVQKMEKES